MALWTITLLADAPANRTIPDGGRLHVFPGRKSIPHCSDVIAERCRYINKVQGSIFSVVEEGTAPVKKAAPAVSIQPIAVEAEKLPETLKKITPVKQERKKTTSKKASKPSKPIRLKTH